MKRLLEREMNKPDLQNEKLDQIGRRLFRAAKLSDEKIEKIVVSPDLFDSVKARIKAQQSETQSKNSFGNRINFPIWNWRMAGLAFGALAILFFGIIGVKVFRQQEPTQLAVQQITPVSQTPVASVENPAQSNLTIDSPQIQKTNDSVISSSKSVQHAVLKNEPTNSKKQAHKLNFKRPMLPESEDKADVYQLTYAGNSEEIAEDEQVIRVELPRSSLLALGVSPPLENESGKVKTDLLIGSDGVVRAVRLVK